MRENFRDDVIQLFRASAGAAGRTKGRFEVAQLTDFVELCKCLANTLLKWKLMNWAK